MGTEAAVSYKGFRFPAEVISHAAWLYHRFPLSYREVEELLLARGIVVSYETIRAWCDRFGPQYAAGLRRRRPRAGDKWHLDEVFVKINGVRHYLWRNARNLRSAGGCQAVSDLLRFGGCANGTCGS